MHRIPVDTGVLKLVSPVAKLSFGIRQPVYCRTFQIRILKKQTNVYKLTFVAYLQGENVALVPPLIAGGYASLLLH